MTLEGQKIYDDTFDIMLDVSPIRALWYVRQLRYPESKLIKYERLINYFQKTKSEDWLPLTCFVPILFKKDRMSLAFLPESKMYDEGKAKEIIFSYIMEQNVKKLFIPPEDILFKVGNSLYNNNGKPERDYIRCEKQKCGFLYQYFLAQPLSPREVWLPDKRTKRVNLFWQIIGKQIVKCIPEYPPSDPDILWGRIAHLLTKGVIRFDISGFGFQFPRALLRITAEVICELYPCDQLDYFTQEFTDILSDVTVEKNYELLRPHRGIGLGYFEYLKTITMAALLSKHRPISLYGDQGILPVTGFDGIIDLLYYDFHLKDDKVEVQSYDIDYRMKWAGHGMMSDAYRLVKVHTNPLLGALFGRVHWERKRALYGFYQENPSFYKLNYKKIRRFYTMVFGEEFPEESYHFLDGGINPFSGIKLGEDKCFILTKYEAPFTETLFDVMYVTPFLKKEAKKYPHGIAKGFQREREKAYRNFTPIPSSVFFYTRPRLEYMKRYTPRDNVIPDWADLLFLSYYGMTAGNFFYGFPQEKLLSIASKYTLADNPLEAASRGGYKILDPVHETYHPLGKWWEQALQFLQTVDMRKIPYLPRVDIGLAPPYFSEDKLYFNTNLISYEAKTSRPGKRKFEDITPQQSEEYLSILNKVMTKRIHGGILNHLSDVLPIFEEVRELDQSEGYHYDYEGIIEDYSLEDIEPYNDL